MSFSVDMNLLLRCSAIGEDGTHGGAAGVQARRFRAGMSLAEIVRSGPRQQVGELRWWGSYPKIVIVVRCRRSFSLARGLLPEF